MSPQRGGRRAALMAPWGGEVGKVEKFWPPMAPSCPPLGGRRAGLPSRKEGGSFAFHGPSPFPPPFGGIRGGPPGLLGASCSRIIGENFGSELEVHGVVMVPSSAPDEAVLLEDEHQLVGDAVGVGDALRFPFPGVLP